MSDNLILVGDFETTVYDGQAFTEVWASALVELGTEDVIIFHSIDETFEYLKSLNRNVTLYYHNLKFDGEFWLSYLILKEKFKQAYIKLDEEGTQLKWLDKKDMQSKTFKYSISDQGQWYTITIKVGSHFIEIRDSLKLMPFSVKRIGDGFKTKHRKLDMEYEGFRYAGCEITPQEKEYIANDVLVVKEALEIMFKAGHSKLTIGACCMSEYKKICKHSMQNMLDYNEMFPNIYDMPLDESYGALTMGEYVRNSYKGGWCYCVAGKENKVYGKGITADVNSLYPSMMSSESGNRYPIGVPNFWKGDIPDKALEPDKYFIVRIRTKFYIKKNKLPFIQIKNNLLYRGNDCLETSDLYDKRKGKYCDKAYDFDGNLVDVKVTLTLTCTDWYLMNEHYNLVDCEILDGCWFYTQIGIFDEYINPYKKQKQESKGALRELAKLFLNNLYGKFATNTNSSFKVAYIKEDESLGYITVVEHEKKPSYIPVGTAITSYARNFTIRTAQKNYHGVNKRGFIYADTDSIHCNLNADELVGVPVHDTDFCHWKLEATWDCAIFARQKTYIEHVVEENLKPCEPYYNIKGAGMQSRPKELFNISLDGTQKIDDNWTDEEKEFLFNEDGTPRVRQLEDFKVNLNVPSGLKPKRIKGGVVLVNTPYTMRAR